MSSLHIWVDADACPKVIKAILFRAAERVKLPLTLVANSKMQHPKSSYIDSVIVQAGADVADAYIIDHCKPGDLAITADIPLAAGMIEKHAYALNPRGEMYTIENVRSALSMRDFMEKLRGDGVMTGGPALFSQSDRQSFSNQLDRFLTRYLKEHV
ncbi:MAG: YaiI/YqxD family protein [Mariprofundus sp.]|nr:YaiI/YqxD family protein [Mariprofundus sp.]